jgi:N-acetylglucosamine kinase-like BadF-type ATPase
MILIADSGASKTDWRLISDKEVVRARTAGFNPYFQTSEEIYTEVAHTLLPQLNGQDVDEIYFYGSGCSSEKNCQLVQSAIGQAFPKAAIQINHDLLAAARALCGHEPGIACILGTGVNSCLYNGQEIIAGRPSLGFWLGDEGSGGYLGKVLIQKYFHEEMPAYLRELFREQFSPRLDLVLENAYKKPFPNSYFASFSRFLFDKLADPFCYGLVYEGFAAFFERYVKKYENAQQYNVSFTGSVAFHYQEILRAVAADQGVSLKNILESPIAGLTQYHLAAH